MALALQHAPTGGPIWPESEEHQVMSAKKRFPESSPRSLSTVRPSFDATALGAQLATTLVQVVQVRTAYTDRCHQREVLFDAAVAQARAWDAEAQRRHEAFHGTLALATKLVESGHVDQALEVLSRGTALLAPMEVAPTLLSAMMEVA